MNICKLTLNCIAVHRCNWTAVINHTAGTVVCTTRDYGMCSDASHLTLTNRCHMCAYIRGGKHQQTVCCEWVFDLYSSCHVLLNSAEVSLHFCWKWGDSSMLPKGLYFGPPKLLCPWYRPQVNPSENPIKQTSPPSPGHLVQRSPANSINPNHWGNLSGPASGTVPGFRLNMTDYSIWA